MKQEDRETLEKEMLEFREEILKDEKLRKQIEEIIVEEAILAEQIAKHETLKRLALGPADILPKIDDILQKLWDWWKKRKKKEA